MAVTIQFMFFLLIRTWQNIALALLKWVPGWEIIFTDFNAANGKVYKWIQPVNGVPQGNYEPATVFGYTQKTAIGIVGYGVRFIGQKPVKNRICL